MTTQKMFEALTVVFGELDRVVSSISDRSDEFDEKNYDNYDIIIDTEGTEYPGWDSFELCNQRILIYASPKSHLCGNKLRMEQFSSGSFANSSIYGNHYQVLQNACQKAGFTPNVARVIDSACFMRIISLGVAIGTAGELYAKVGNIPTVIPLDITDFKEYQTVCIYYKKSCIRKRKKVY